MKILENKWKALETLEIRYFYFLREQKVAKSRNIFARQLVPATFCSRDFLFQ